MSKILKFLFMIGLLLAVGVFLAGCDTVKEVIDNSNADDRIIVYTLHDDADGDYEIWSLNLDTGGLTKLTDNSYKDLSPRFSPDGSKIAFITNQDQYEAVYTMNPDGTGRTRISNFYTAIHDVISWSPDGTELLFAAKVNSGDDFDIYKLNIASGFEYNLTYTYTRDSDGETSDETYPSWAPYIHTDIIAFASDKTGNQNIFLMDSAGELLQQITYCHPQEYHAHYPAWSPDGDRIAVVETYLCTNPIIWYTNICLLHTDNNYAFDKYLTISSDYLNFYPTWSPDGEKMSFVSNMHGNLNLYLFDREGNNIVQLTDYQGSEYVESHDWKPSN